MPAQAKILVVDDDDSVRDAIASYLQAHDYCVEAADGAAALDAALARTAFDLVILDVMMPGEDGLQICRRLPAGSPPVLMLSALGDVTDRIVGLELGASDYLAKPFDPRELLARIKALLRRTPSLGEEPARLAFDGWRLDLEERRLIAPGGAEVALTAGDFRLLRAFVERPGRLLTRQLLIDLARDGSAEPFDRAIDLAVSRLRRKLESAAPGGAALIETLRGDGYRFRAAVRRL
ncbi:response regulator transcription factor [Sphingomonas sinipercae]|uniref:Response regulator transcription factor n=1 Tax=Sphingomonas sinipercae TaxID=2714944 RepID=A0A6G7ZQ28_9SPHN|nr:response regulator transcription factor [Sphingomonas sinipercae]QIL03006.1 response regulator transcription factor [Sphingomonas sinipercae]